MPLTQGSEVVDVDTEAVVAVASDAVEGTLYSVVEFDESAFHWLYVADETVAMYADREEMEAHFERIHNYVNLDFMERRLFTQDLLPVADRVRYKTTAMDVMKLTRLYLDDTRGLFLALDADERVEPIVAAVEDVIDTA